MMTQSPDILVICTDQQRFDAVSTHPGSPAITPAIARLADAGAVFENCYSASPVCAPSRASMLTGTYPSAHGLWANGVALPPTRLVTRELAEVGYRCGLIGKLHLAPAYNGLTERRGDDGFDEFHWAHDPSHGSPDNAYHAWLRSKHPEIWHRLEDLRVSSRSEDVERRKEAFADIALEAHYSRWVAETAAEFVTSTPPHQPFMLWANFFDPHHPFAAPKAYRDLYPPGSVPPPIGGETDLDARPEFLRTVSSGEYTPALPSFGKLTPDQLDELRRTYFAMVSLVDDCVGEILAALAATGRDRNTLVIFTSDHGEMLGDHGLLLKGPMMYEGAVRVPLIIRWPEHVPAGTRVPGLVSLLDIASTIRRQVGLPTPDQGIDLVEVVSDRSPAREYTISEYRDSCFPGTPRIDTTMIRDQRFKLIAWHHYTKGAERAGELYDLQADPQELTNLFYDPRYVAVRLRLLEVLIDHLVAAEDRSAPREYLY